MTGEKPATSYRWTSRNWQITGRISKTSGKSPIILEESLETYLNSYKEKTGRSQHVHNRLDPMIRKNRQLVTDEPVEFEK